MNKTVRGAGAFLVVLGVLCFFRLALPSSMTISDELSPFFKSFPMTLGVWKGEEIAPDPRDLEILETRNVLSRNYTNLSGDSIHLLLVSSKKDRRVAHPPEVCYISSNFNVINASEETVAVADTAVPVKYFTASPDRNPEVRQEVLYLYKIGSEYTTNYYAQQLHFALDKLSKADTEVLLIRIAGKKRSVLEAFLKELLPHLN